ncbi:hypothetical protein ACLGL2_01055 [Parvimonas sp. G1641]|uniref:hypothetical protein n=1 Tax=Parvimonas sp. G1641 TaxID=3388846 RepID=UPI00397F6540
MKKHFKKVVIILLLLFTSFLCWLDGYEPKKEVFKHSNFYIKNVESNKKVLENSKLYNEKYRQYLQNKIQEKEKQKQEQEEQQQQQEQEQEEKQERKSKKKKKGRGRGRKSSKKVKEDDGKIKEKTQRVRMRKEQENNRLDKYIFKHKMKSKKRL